MGNKTEKAKEIGKTVVKVASVVAAVGGAVFTALNDKDKG